MEIITFMEELSNMLFNSKLLPNDRYNEILKLRFGYYGKIFTFQEIGNRLGGVSKQRIKQLVEKSLEMFRNDEEIRNYVFGPKLKKKY